MTVPRNDDPGGWSAPRTGEDRSNYDVSLSRLASADFVMCCIPIDQLLESYKSGAACPLSKMDNVLFNDYCSKWKPNRYPSIMYVITKAIW